MRRGTKVSENCTMVYEKRYQGVLGEVLRCIKRGTKVYEGWYKAV
jgi:hypothetical protein